MKLDLKEWISKVTQRFKCDMTYVTALNGITGGLRLWKDYTTGTVRCYGFFRSSANISSSTAIFQVPEGYRPLSQYGIPMFLAVSGGAGAGYYGTVEANGNIYQSLGSVIREGFISAEWYYA